jgi:cell division protein FtsI/penicillin-binding protein 2
MSNKVTQITDNTYSIEFCGYFPYEKPQYSIIVALTKNDTQGGLAADVVKLVAEYLIK